MYVSIRMYEVAPGASMDEIVRRVNEDFIPIISDTPGFIAYYAIKGGCSEVTSVSVFHDQAGAEESNRRAADWVAKNLVQFIAGPPMVVAGDIIAYKTM
jgi:hypothetical protein